MALILARISAVTSSGATENTVAAISAWKSLPERKASIRLSSPLRCAMMRISICE